MFSKVVPEQKYFQGFTPACATPSPRSSKVRDIFSPLLQNVWYERCKIYGIHRTATRKKLSVSLKNPKTTLVSPTFILSWSLLVLQILAFSHETKTEPEL